MSKIISKLFIAIILLAIIPVVSAGDCECPGDSVEPNYGTAVVNGNYSEWNTSEGSADFFGNMYEAGISNDNHDLLSKVYIRYDCNSRILYTLVLLVDDDDYLVGGESDDHFVKLDCQKAVDATYSEKYFQYIYNGTKIIGWEAKTNVEPNTYYLDIHTQVYPDNTSAFVDRCINLNICCIPIPEFSTIALPIAAILGLMFILQSRRRKED